MKPSKTPGIDGIPMEFYYAFWSEIKEHLLDVIKEVYFLQTLTESQSNAILTLLFKNKGERTQIRNWRPISLLCVDYKIITKTLASRLKRTLTSLISPDQTCGVPGRSIHSNITLVRNIIYHAKQKHIQAYILTIDQEKAFDKVSTEFLDKVLQTMNFGQYFRNWIKTIYTNITSDIHNNGYFSERICIKRGVRQGCPLSPLLYILIVETLAEAIKQDPLIRGYKLGGADIKKYLNTRTTQQFFCET